MRAWVDLHNPVEIVLQLAVTALLILLAVVALGGAIYAWAWVRRLWKRENRVEFIQRPYPEVKKGKLGSGEIELVESLKTADQSTLDAIEALRVRITALETKP